MTLTTLGLLLMSLVSADTPYPQLAWRMVVMACGLALTMAPATESIMGSLPLAKAGVGSAVNDTTRQVGGALGVAVIGSVFTSIYGSRIADSLSGQGIPSGAVDAAQDSIGGAIRVASSIGDAAGDLITQASRSAFMDGLRTASRAGALVTLIGVFITLRWLPARARPRDVELQAEEFAAEHRP
jgi:hypothetical protein